MKHIFVRQFLLSIGPVAIRNLSGPIGIAFGTLMNIRNGRSANPRYDHIHTLYKYLKGKATDEYAVILGQLKPLSLKQVRSLAAECDMSYHTLMKIRRAGVKFAPSCTNVNLLYTTLRTDAIAQKKYFAVKS